MTTSPFDTGWSVRSPADADAVAIDLPHDAMISEQRDPAEPSWAHGAYFPGGKYIYRKEWTPGPDLAGKQVSLRFEGVYRHSRVLLDGHDVGGCPSGYREFEVPLDSHLRPGSAQVLEVEVDNTATPSSRWYTGSGIYRPVWLEVRGPVHVHHGGISLTTHPQRRATHVAVSVVLSNPDCVAVDVDVTLTRAGRPGGTGRATTLGGTAEVELVIGDADLWSADSPALYELRVVLSVEGEEADRVQERAGLRTIHLDPLRGLLVNGTVTKLRGANVHHDNGVLGAATFAGAERRRIRLLKNAGFNAIRSAHNPASRALLDACDEYGMYVMDEAYDGWYDHKTDNDDASLFDVAWRDDLASMVAKDRLHPSVVLYSIGNETGEAFSPRGRRTAAELAAELHKLDPTRFTTIGVNLVAATFAGIGNSHLKETDPGSSQSAPDMTSTALNVISNRFGVLMKAFPRLRAAERSTRELFESVDVAGYNYGTSRYRTDAARHPGRLMVGTETMPGDLARNWTLVRELPSLLGDFVWAGWDYLGEAGGGTWTYGTRRAPFLKPYPQLVSGMGIFDITGVPGAAIRLAQAAWGVLTTPAITVRPLDVPSGPVARTAWRATDAVESWSWAGHEGRPAHIEVYSTDEEVELRLNGRSLGRRPAGVEHGFVARFRTVYARGTLEAIGYRGGVAVSQSHLSTAGPVRIRLAAEEPLGRSVSDIAHVHIELADSDGIVDPTAVDVVSVSVDGPAVVQGLGSGAPATEESFTDSIHSTYRGRAFAVVRSTGRPGPVSVRVTTLAHGEALLALERTERGTSDSHTEQVR